MAEEGSTAPGRGLQRVIYSVLVGLLLVLLTTAYFFVRAARLEQERSLAESDALARRTVFCTGDVVTEEVHVFIEGTGCPVVSKPFELSQFFDAVARAASR